MSTEDVVRTVEMTKQKREEVINQARDLLEIIKMFPYNTEAFRGHILKRVEAIERRGQHLTRSLTCKHHDDKFWARVAPAIQEEMCIRTLLDEVTAELNEAHNLLFQAS